MTPHGESGAPARPADIAANRARSRALPMFGDGHIPPDRDRRVEEDDTSFSQVMYLFLRPWPYIRLQFLGRWWIPGKGLQDGTADLVSSEGCGFGYAPFLVAAAAAAGPLFELVPPTFEWPLYLVYVPAITLSPTGSTRWSPAAPAPSGATHPGARISECACQDSISAFKTRPSSESRRGSGSCSEDCR